ncbi:unnamed protein product, partial [Symbiodinium microadriaticum]
MLKSAAVPATHAQVESQGQVAIARRPVFEAQTLAVSQLRQQIEGPDEKWQDLQPAERRFRLTEQARRLRGMSLRGPLECSFSCYTIVIRMLAADEISYSAPSRFTTRAHEVQQAKPPKEVIIDSSSSIKVRDSSELADTCHLPDALSLSQALQRRSLALDLCEAASFEASERWRAELLRHLQQAPPVEFKQVDIMQILRADRAAWTFMAEKANSLKKRADGSLPMDDLFDSLTGSTEVMMFLMPLPAGGHHKRPAPPDHTATATADPTTPPKKSRTRARRDRQKQRLQARVCGRPLQSVHKTGIGSVFGIDAWIPKSAPAPIVKLDLQLHEDTQVLFLLLANRALAAVHLAPPASLHSRGGGSQLRSSSFPDGIPGLLPVDADKMSSFNQLYALSSVIFLRASQALPALLDYHLQSRGSHEGDSASTFCSDSLCKGSANYFLLGAYKCLPRIGVTKLTSQHLGTASFINAFLKQRFPSDTWSAFVVTHNEASALHVDTCNTPGSKNFAVGLGGYTGGELFVEDPGGSVPFHDDATGEWLWGEKHALNLEPCTFDGFARHATLPWEGDRWTIIAYSAVSQGDLSSEQEQLLLSCGFPLPWSQPNTSTAHRPETRIRMTVGVPWEPRDFAREAARRGHPRHLFDAVPPVLKAAIDATLVMSETALSQHRTEVLRRWMLRAQELESKEAQLHASMPKHLAGVLEGKRLLVFGEMLADSGYGDTSIASEIGKGFDLTGPLPSSGGLFKPIVEAATMTRECLRAAAPAVRAGILQATEKACMSELAQEIHDITQDEVTRGWLSAPIPVEELGDTCSLSRRFGVVQSSAGKRKVRPIDNLSESFINSTVSRVESIQPHGLDVVCAGIAYRLRVRERVGKQSVPKLKVIDLFKAYKQLGLSVDALQDSFLCVPNPTTGKPCVHMCHVLPFG